ncbi:hypothetical protein F4804DRAFT_320827 [Jackrogersella minutella]|nr:hypothetical protein F4804DRAFT_320827 [Jackrogersella minutella]
MLTNVILEAMFGSWPYDQGPIEPSAFVAFLVHVAKLLEIPIPRATFLDPLLYLFILAFFSLLALVFVGTIIETFNRTELRGERNAPLFRLMKRPVYLLTAISACWFIALAAAAFLLATAMFWATGWIAVFIIPAVWALQVLWLGAGSFFRLQYTAQGQRNHSKPRPRVAYVQMLLTLAAFVLIPSLRLVADMGIARLFAWNVEV